MDIKIKKIYNKLDRINSSKRSHNNSYSLLLKTKINKIKRFKMETIRLIKYLKKRMIIFRAMMKRMGMTFR